MTEYATAEGAADAFVLLYDEVAGRGGPTYSRPDLEAVVWTVSLSIGG